MLAPFTYLCRCGSEFTTGAAELPPGWQRIDGQLLCIDCLAAYEDAAPDTPAPSSLRGAAGDAAIQAPPTPIRPDGSDSATSILLRSGVYLDLADPDCTRISPVDIAAGLRQFRFAAQTAQPYTIAQHCLLVRDLVETVCAPADAPADWERRMAIRCALLHDAAEAFLHDVTRPLKIQLPDYQRVEGEFQHRFDRAFGLTWTPSIRALVKQADLQALAIEQRDIVGNSDPWPVLDKINRAALYYHRITRIWSPEEAEARFLDAYHALAAEPEGIAA